MTIPGGPGEERVINEVPGRADVAFHREADCLGAHGDGSDPGDPIEVLAAGAGPEQDPRRTGPEAAP